MSSCCPKPQTLIKPEPVTVFVDKYVPVPEKLTKKCKPVYEDFPRWIKTATWLDLHYENSKTIDMCNKKLELIDNLTSNENE